MQTRTDPREPTTAQKLIDVLDRLTAEDELVDDEELVENEEDEGGEAD